MALEVRGADTRHLRTHRLSSLDPMQASLSLRQISDRRASELPNLLKDFRRFSLSC